MKIVVLAFNIGPAKRFTNGPGMSLHNFVKSIGSRFKVDIFTTLRVEQKIDSVNYYSIENIAQLKSSIRSSDYVHHWSGISNHYAFGGKVANDFCKPLIIGPNVLDTVQKSDEKTLLNTVSPSYVLSVNDRLKYKISKEHELDLSRMSTFIVGPEMELWRPNGNDTGFIMWKGNSKHFAKDIDFGLKLEKALPQYNFKFIGHPSPYLYSDHIDLAKSASLYVGTSISETKSQTLMESWASGVCSVTHPKIYLHGKNYETGIITNKTIEDYSEAIIEIMEDERLRGNLRAGAYEYAVENFSSEVLFLTYCGILGSL